MPQHAHARRLRGAVVLILAVSLVFLVVQMIRTVRAATAGEGELRSARQALQEQRVSDAQDMLRKAQRHFGTAQSALGNLGPFGPVVRVAPLLRVQLRATRNLVDAGVAGSRAARDLSPLLEEARTAGRTTDETVRRLAAARPVIDGAIQELAEADRRIRELRGYRLVGPLGSRVRSAQAELDAVLSSARRARRGLTVGLELAGADGPRRYLLLSQNPDEVRPTGGYMGTYGVATGANGRISLPTYGATDAWTTAHPQARLPLDESPFLFRYVKVPQDLTNSNAVPDWPTSARTAAAMWSRGGEPAVDGVVTFMPALLVRLVTELGEVRVPGYPDVLNGDNVDARIEYYTHGAGVQGRSGAPRKAFVAELAPVVLNRLMRAPADQLPDLLSALSAGLTAGEGAMWSRSDPVQAALEGLSWDGSFPSADGDFYADVAFAFAAKNGRGLHRTFEHSVALTADGSGMSDTVMVLRNSLPYQARSNESSQAYVTPYGPRGGLRDLASDPPDRTEPDLDGHPTAGWFRSARPMGATRLHVRWQAPGLAVPRDDGTWDYRLTWVPTPGHLGDTLDLSVSLPPGARWIGAPPPRQVRLQGAFRGSWRFAMASS
jgi:hypothetical protein